MQAEQMKLAKKAANVRVMWGICIVIIIISIILGW